MKLKYIFLSLLTLATLSGCDNEELIGPGSNNNNQGEGLPAVLMINGSTNENVETKADNSDGDLYVFVFDSNGAFLGKGCSKETETDKSTKIATIVNTEVVPLSKDVIVVGDEMLSGTVVDVILIANPPEDVVDLYKRESISLNDLNDPDLKASLDDQIVMYENEGRSTSCQRLKMTLDSGINFLGESRRGVTGQSWCRHKYEYQIRLYRLISAVRFDKVDFGENTTGCFILTKAYLKNAYDQSMLFPSDELSFNDPDITPDDWKKLIKNETVSDISANNMIKVRDDMRGVLIYSKGNDNSPLQYKGSNSYIGSDYGLVSLKEQSSYLTIAKDIYSFEGDGKDSKVTLVMEGYYADAYTNYEDVITAANKCQYEVDLEKGRNGEYVKFRRNCIYNVSVTIFGKGTPTGGGEEIPGKKNIDAMIEIATMASAKPVFEFGGK